MMEAVFLSFLNAGVMASWTVLAVLLVRQLCRKCPRKIAVLFWLPVGFRFLIPASLPSPLSIFNLLRSGVETNETALTVNQYVPGDIGMMEAPQVSVGIGSVDEIVSAALPAAEPTYSANPMQIWTAIGAWVWVIGMVVMLTWAIVRYALLRRRLRFAVPVAGQPDTYTGEMVPTPFLTGIFRPRIYLPLGLDEGLTDTVLRHERAHIRYRDPVWKLAAYLVLTVHWYNPLCWAAVMLLGRDLELRCDEAVLAEVDAKTYGMALVTLAAGRRFSPVSPLAFGESSVGSRVKHILKWKKPAKWVGILTGVVCVALVVVFATDAMASPIQWTSQATAEELLDVMVTHHEGDMRGRIFLTEEQRAALSDILLQLTDKDMTFSPMQKRSGKKYLWMRLSLDTITDRYPQTLIYIDDHIYLTSGQWLNDSYPVMWKVDDPSLTAWVEAILGEMGPYMEPLTDTMQEENPFERQQEISKSIKRWDIELSGDSMSKDFEVTPHYPYAEIWIYNEGTEDIRFTITKGSPTGEVMPGSNITIAAGKSASVSSTDAWSADIYYANFTCGKADMCGTASCHVTSSMTAAVQWETILNVSISTTPANRNVYDTFPPAVADILTAIEKVPDARREQITDKEAFFLHQPEPMPGFIHMDIERTGQVLSMVSLYVRSEDTVGVRQIDHYIDDTQVTKAFFTITDKKIAAAILDYCDSLQDKEIDVAEPESPVKVVDLTPGSYIAENGFIPDTETDYHIVTPVIHLTESSILRIKIDAGDTLTVEENYLVTTDGSVISGSTSMEDEFRMSAVKTHTLTREEDGLYSLPVKEHNPGTGESNSYTVYVEGGRYVFLVYFDKDMPITPLT